MTEYFGKELYENSNKDEMRIHIISDNTDSDHENGDSTSENNTSESIGNSGGSGDNENGDSTSENNTYEGIGNSNGFGNHENGDSISENNAYEGIENSNDSGDKENGETLSEDTENEDSSSLENETEEGSEESASIETETISDNGFISMIERKDFVKGICFGVLMAAIVAVVAAMFVRRKKNTGTTKEPGMPMRLEVYSGQCLTDPSKLELRDGVLLGSSKKCDICFEGEGVEPEHAKIVIQNGQAYIVDLESKNGVTVGGMRIQDKNPLRSGYVIGLGDVEFMLNY